ncbi:hypothetical protein QF023_000753 [Chryseobacterium sp. SLBN-27]|nr:hypothetical protein [Chryseobacterium sp. SLBN-27]
MKISEIVSKQKEFFNTHQTKNIKFRRMYLEKLKELIISNETFLYEAKKKISANQDLILLLRKSHLSLMISIIT